MLQALELVGFKSFADRTRFEFPKGITVVVGPNGSGKSNVVDAIKWVLGEQSAKSLRGREMADVIFNGSASRRALNSAEITLTLDNASKLLAVDTPQVHVTRRVYRSGEGEYLINRQPCRLRDFRDLFAGTGIATEAYSVIEQGKVDVMLQSSPRDRRVIFEEAAGISRFKAKKIEAARRLERVEQNLLRLSDIVEEVESRLRSVRLQASKARRYREYAGRLQELRTQTAAADWRRLTERLAELDSEGETLRQEADRGRAEVESLEASALALEAEVAHADQSIRDGEARIGDNRERIAAAESMIEHQRIRSRELEQEAARHRRQIATLGARAGDLEQRLAETRALVASAQAEHGQLRRQLADDERVLTEITAQLDRLRGENESRRGAYVENMRAAAALASQVNALAAQADASDVVIRRCAERIAQFESAASRLADDIDLLERQESERIEAAQVAAEQLDQAHTSLVQRRGRLSQEQKDLSRLVGRLAAATERCSVLEELEKRQEGLSAGVKQLLADVRSSATSAGAPSSGTLSAGEASADGVEKAFRQIRGLVADVLDVQVDTAPLIDAALGESAGHLVVAPGRELFELLESQTYRFAGRVGFVPLDANAFGAQRPRAVDGVDLEGRAGVLGRADRFIHARQEFVPLAARLLGRTWIVERLTHALALAATDGRGQDFVTLAGEVVRADGTVIVGPRLASTGLISRRSELRVLRQQIADQQGKVAQAERGLAELEREIIELDLRVESLGGVHRRAEQALAEHRAQTRAARERRGRIDEQLAALCVEHRAAEAERAAAARTLDELGRRQIDVHGELARSEERIAEDRAAVERLDAERLVNGRKTTAAKVELAKGEERLDHLETQLRQFDDHRQERHRAVDEARGQLAECGQRSDESERQILRGESEVAELYLRKEALAAEVVAWVERRDGHRQGRGELAIQTQRRRAKVKKSEEQLHAVEMGASEVRHERAAVADRLREDYGIELAELEHRPSAEELLQREEVEREIVDLRQKINSMGGVNLDALAELDELETRYNSLSSQHKDLSAAKHALEQIIERINADSRRLFEETLQTVRGHFQQLFRKLFGGGQADIVVEEGVDILDGGIEIVARPPGKEPRSISLLSGGEKTLTCVALLLAIFRSKPSPFCVLDEVDAALDEANIERFVAVLHEFLTITQFIVVTHSKKTMTAATTLYGVTMQESGVSKRVSVRFEDVSDDGEISQEAIARSSTEPHKDADDGAFHGGTDESRVASAIEDETQAA